MGKYHQFRTTFTTMTGTVKWEFLTVVRYFNISFVGGEKIAMFSLKNGCDVKTLFSTANRLFQKLFLNHAVSAKWSA